MSDERTYSTVDKSGWGDGPWRTEPDKVVWVDAGTGLDCMVHRAPGGALCGYVGVSPTHPWHGKDYSDCTLVAPCDEHYCAHAVDGCLEVHGGLTYAATCQEAATEESGICHVPAPGRPDDVWWFGFDCAHCFDLSPKFAVMSARPALSDDVYRDLAYVRSEVTELAQQLAGVSA